MAIRKAKFSLLMAVVATLTSASCSTAQSESDVNFQKTAETAHIETVKPGAAISLTHSKPAKMTAGQFASVSLNFDEHYDEGDLQVDITTSDGLTVFGNESRKSFLLGGASNHTWPINVSAAEDGIYFVNVFATVSDQNKNISSQRSFSIRLDVGDITPAMQAKAFPENGTLSSDGSLRILTAQETIQ